MAQARNGAHPKISEALEKKKAADVNSLYLYAPDAVAAGKKEHSKLILLAVLELVPTHPFVLDLMDTLKIRNRFRRNFHAS